MAVRGDPAKAADLVEREGFIPPGRNLPSWPLSLPLDWSADPFGDRNWQFHLHAWRMIDPALLTHEQRGESRYLDWALAIVFDWAEWHLRDNRKARALRAATPLPPRGVCPNRWLKALLRPRKPL